MTLQVDPSNGDDKWGVGSTRTPKTEEQKPKIEVFGNKQYKEVYTKDGKAQLAILVEDSGLSPYELLNKIQGDFAKNNPAPKAEADSPSADLPPELKEILDRQKIGKMDLRELPPAEESEEIPDAPNTPNGEGKTPAPKDEPEIELEPPKINLPELKKPGTSGELPELAPGKIDSVPDKIDVGKPVRIQEFPSEYNSENPHPNAGKTTTGNTGYSMVVQDDGSYKYYNPEGEEIPAEEFRKRNPNMYSSSLAQNWGPMDGKTLSHKRGNVTVSDYNYQLIKTFGDPALYQKNENGRYVNPYTGETINENVYNQLCEAYEDITK